MAENKKKSKEIKIGAITISAKKPWIAYSTLILLVSVIVGYMALFIIYPIMTNHLIPISGSLKSGSYIAKVCDSYNRCYKANFDFERPIMLGDLVEKPSTGVINFEKTDSIYLVCEEPSKILGTIESRQLYCEDWSVKIIE